MKEQIDRRRFVGRALGATGVVAASSLAGLAGCGKGKDAPGGAAGGIVAGKRVHWRLASSFPHGLDTIFGAAETLSRRVDELTQGAFKIRVHAAGEIVPGLQVLDAVSDGSVELGHSASYYYTGKNPAFAFDTCLPFGLTSRQHTAWLLSHGGLELLRKLFADFNVVNFPGGNTGAQMGGWFRREVNTTSDLKGLKMRIPGLGGKVMSDLGVTVQVLPGGDIYPALELGAIDAAEWVGPYDDEKLGFYKVAKNYYYPGWWEPGPALSFYVNRTAWDKLPKAYQQVFELACREATFMMQSEYDAKNPDALERLLKEGVTMRPFSQEIMQASAEASEAAVRDPGRGDGTYRKILDEWTQVRKRMFGWFRTAELAYEQFAFQR